MALHEVVINAVFEERLIRRRVVESAVVGGVFAEQQRGFRARLGLVAVQRERPQILVAGLNVALGRGRQRRPVRVVAPGPGVAKPELRQQVQLRIIGSAVDDGELDEHVLGISLGELHEHIKVAVFVEDGRVHQLEFGLQAVAAGVFLHQPLVGEGVLRVLVQHPLVGVRGRGIEVVVHLFHVLAVVALRAAQAKQALLQNRVLPVPKPQAEAEQLLVVAEAGQGLLAPAVGAAAGLVVGGVVPGVAAGRVVFAHGAPLPLGHVGPESAPGFEAVPGFLEALVFGGHGFNYQLIMNNEQWQLRLALTARRLLIAH